MRNGEACWKGIGFAGPPPSLCPTCVVDRGGIADPVCHGSLGDNLWMLTSFRHWQELKLLLETPPAGVADLKADEEDPLHWTGVLVPVSQAFGHNLLSVGVSLFHEQPLLLSEL